MKKLSVEIYRSQLNRFAKKLGTQFYQNQVYYLPNGIRVTANAYWKLARLFDNAALMTPEEFFGI